MNTPRKQQVSRLIRRRPNDFDSHRGVVVYNGTCCCCCCLHWLGAAAGAAAGLSVGAHPRPRFGVLVHRRARRNAVIGGLLGLLSSVIVGLLAYEAREQSILGFLAFVPCAVFLPVWLGMFAGSNLTRDARAGEAEQIGYGCLTCGYDLRGSLESRRCPECGKPFNPSAYPHQLESKYRFAWRAGGYCVAFSVLGTLAGYAVMWAIGKGAGWF